MFISCIIRMTVSKTKCTILKSLDECLTVMNLYLYLNLNGVGSEYNYMN